MEKLQLINYITTSREMPCTLSSTFMMVKLKAEAPWRQGHLGAKQGIQTTEAAADRCQGTLDLLRKDCKSSSTLTYSSNTASKICISFVLFLGAADTCCRKKSFMMQSSMQAASICLKIRTPNQEVSQCCSRLMAYGIWSESRS